MSTIKRPPAHVPVPKRAEGQPPAATPATPATAADIASKRGLEGAARVATPLPALDIFDDTKPAPLECTTLAAVAKLHEQGKLDEVRRAGAQNLGVMKQLLDDLIGTWQTGTAKLQGPKGFWVGDIEGREDNQLRTLIDAGVIVSKGDGGDARLADPGSRVVFLGDIGDRGGVAMWARRVLTSLKTQRPDAVDIVWGNRCLAKLGLLNDLPALEKLDDAGYRSFLAKQAGSDHPAKLKALNTPANQVQYWLQGHGAREELDFHRTELAESMGRPVSLDEAARHYVESLKPGGEYFEFLKLGNWGVTPDRAQAPVMAWHGGASRESIRQVPLDDQLPSGALDYGERWMKMGADLIAEVERSIRTTGRVPAEILSLGDSDWDARAGQNSFKAFSNTYGMRDKEQGNYRGVSEAVAAFYAKDGVHFEPVGHSPVPQLPLPMKSAELGGVTRIYNDTSFTNDKSTALTANVGDLFVMVGRLGDEKTGEIVVWTVKPDEKSPIGLVTEDGFTVRGITLDGHYALTRYVDGHDIANKKVTPQDLAALKPRAVTLESSEEANEGRDRWFKDLGRFGYETLTSGELNDLLGKKTPIVISAASEYGKLPIAPDDMKKMWAGLLHAFGDDAGFLTGGTNVEKTWRDELGETKTVKAPEYIFHEMAGARGATMIGFVPEQTNTSSLPDAKQMKHLYVAGRKSEWDAPLFSSVDVATSRKGAAVFVGGGGTITRALEEARKKPELQVVLVVSRDVEDKADRMRRGEAVELLGASDRAAVELLAAGDLPKNFLLVKPGDDLGGLLKKRLSRSS